MTQTQLIPSFVRRLGRNFSQNKRNILTNSASLINCTDQALNPEEIFGNKSEIWLEIGFGNGEFLANNSHNNPAVNFIGCEAFPGGIVNLAKMIKDRNLYNIRIFNNDARILLKAMPDNSIKRIYILFPDPWPKTKHHKRRLISKDFLNLIYAKLEEKARVILATDHQGYAEWMLEHFNSNANFTFTNGNKTNFQLEPEGWFKTKYQKRAENMGLTPYFFDFTKI